MQIDRAALEAWQREQPLSVLQLDPADRAVLRVAGGCHGISATPYGWTFYTWVIRSTFLVKCGQVSECSSLFSFLACLLSGCFWEGGYERGVIYLTRAF